MEIGKRLGDKAEYTWTPLNPQQGRYWTHCYPSTALIPMMGLVKFVRRSKLETIQKPVLVIYSPLDIVVNPQKTERAFARFGSDLKEIKPVSQSENPENHVLAGDILAPGNTETVVKIILDFLARLNIPEPDFGVQGNSKTQFDT